MSCTHLNCHPVQEIWHLTWALLYAKIFINWCYRFLVMPFFKNTLYLCVCATPFLEMSKMKKSKAEWGEILKFKSFSTVYIEILKWQPIILHTGKFGRCSQPSPCVLCRTFPNQWQREQVHFFVFSCSCYFLFLNFDRRYFIHKCKIFSLYGTNFVITTNVFQRKQYHISLNW